MAIHGNEDDVETKETKMKRVVFALIWIRTKHFSLLIPSYKKTTTITPGTWCISRFRGTRYFWIKAMSLPPAGRDRGACTSHRPTWIIAHECRTSERACPLAEMHRFVPLLKVAKLINYARWRRAAASRCARGFPLFSILRFRALRPFAMR